MDYKLLVVDTGSKGKIQSKQSVIDLQGINLGPDTMPISQGGTGLSAWFEFGSRAIRSSFVPSNDSDVVNLIALRNAIAGLQTGAKWRDPVLSILSAPPVGPAEGDRYIIPSTPAATGDFAGHEKDIAEFKGATWTFETPISGWTIRVLDRLNQIWQYEATDWGYGQYESTTASKGCKKVGFDIQRDDTESFENADLSSIAAQLLCMVDSSGKALLASKELGLNDDTMFLFSAASVAPGVQGAFTVRSGGTIEGLTGLVPGKTYYLDTNGQIKLFADITYAVNDKVVRVLKTYASGKAIFCPELEYTILS